MSISGLGCLSMFVLHNKASSDLFGESSCFLGMSKMTDVLSPTFSTEYVV